MVILKIIEENKELSQKELAQKSLRDPASITRTLDILQKKDFISREAIPNNRRQYNIILSDYGKTFVKKNLPIIKKHRAKSTEGLSDDEIKQLSLILSKFKII